ncbi:unnamed protein product [Lepeophtheirus salmonis]|uniref:(salmon louse) hypothetical protein n=1 Tax=Lepeophtheirus salmonis TaxID=72036 RepID=A0A7R8D1N1_LEPSM|nr:unnamed protein product [Lepeophtheirus salmonis]CAF2970686.1 unnamed protein product [Lepeophtheirus salmonis]
MKRNRSGSDIRRTKRQSNWKKVPKAATPSWQCLTERKHKVSDPATSQQGVHSETTAESVETDHEPQEELPLDISNSYSEIGEVEFAVEIQSHNDNILQRQTQAQPYQLDNLRPRIPVQK